MNSHVLIISILIVTIVVIQIFVFISTKKKITLFKQIFPEALSFKTVKVFIPEEFISSSTPEYIFKNINQFSQTPFNMAVSNDGNGENNGHEFQNIEDENDSWVKIQLGFEKRRIKAKNLETYQSEGWVIIAEKDLFN